MKIINFIVNLFIALDIKMSRKLSKSNILAGLGIVGSIVICIYCKFYFCSLLLTIIILIPIVVFLLNKRYKQTNHYQNQFIDILKFRGDQAFTTKIPQNLDIINLGSNQPKFAFNYSDLSSVKGMNWAVGPQTFEYDFMILKKFHSFLRSGAVVIIPVCPLQFFLHKYNHPSLVTKYIGTFEDYTIPDYNKDLQIKEFKYPLLFHPRRIRFLLKDIKEDCRMEIQSNSMNDAQILEDANMWIERCWNNEFKIDIANMRELSDENKKAINANIAILQEMLDFCIERGYKPVIIYLPVTKALGDRFSNSFIDDNIKNYTNQATNERDILILDYLRDNRFQDTSLYFNSFFMNRKGAKFFTKQVLKDLEI